MKVFFDIITNHTADVIDYAGADSTATSARTTEPYRDAAGQRVRRPRLRRAAAPSPSSTPATSFPYTPVFRADGRRGPSRSRPGSTTRRIYHNRGDSTFAGESSTYGDFSASTTCSPSSPRSSTGMDDIYKTLGRLRHRRLPHRHRQARQHGVLAAVRARRSSTTPPRSATTTSSCSARSTTPTRRYLSQFTHARAGSPATLDFGFQGAALGFAQGQARRPAARPLRRRRLLHRHRLQRLRAADLPRQPRHGPHRAAPRAAARGRRPARARPARPLADVPHPRPAGRLLRRRAGLHRATAATRTPARTCSPARSPTTTTTTSSAATSWRAPTPTTTRRHPLYRTITRSAALRADQPGARRRRPGAPLRLRQPPASTPSAASTRRPSASTSSWPTTRRRPRLRPSPPTRLARSSSPSSARRPTSGRLPTVGSPSRSRPCRWPSTGPTR